jgi:subtilisin family serine protease
MKEELKMPRRPSLVPLLAVLLCITSPALARNIVRPRLDRAAHFVPHELLVKFKRGTPAFVRAEIHRGAGAALLRRFARDPRLEQVRLPAGENLDSAIAYYSTRADVQYVQKNFVYHTTASLPPNDEYFDNQYAWQDFDHSGVNALAAWQKTTGRFSVVVADLDTGVDYTHPDLGLNIWTNPGEAGRNCFDERDNDADGYVDDCRGWNFIYGNNDPMDDSGVGHGTHIAGIIGALTDNFIGVAGANWDVQIMPLKTADANGLGTTVTAIQALEYAVAHGATIANFSSGYYSTGTTDNDIAFRDAIKAAGDAGLLFVTSAGNDSIDNDSTPFYPCSFSRADANNPDPPKNILCVAATDNFYSDARLAWFSNYGANTVNLGAPGTGVLSTVQWSGDQYLPLQGTSVSTSFVTGGAALIKACNPSLSSAEIKDILLGTVHPNSDLVDRTTSGGEVDYGAAVNDLRVGDCVAAPTGSAPVAKSGGPYHGNLRKPVQFEGNASSVTGGQILLYFWDFGDGSYGSGEQVSHQYTDRGPYTVTLTVRDNLGAEASESTTVTVNPTGHATGLKLVRSLTPTRQISRRSDLKR